MPSITLQIPPPLKVAGSCVRSCQSSVSLPFQVSRAELRLSTIQFVDASPPARSRGCAAGDQVEDLLCERDDKASGECQKALRALRRVMALKGKTDLHHAPAEQNQADGADQRENEAGKIADRPQRIRLTFAASSANTTSSSSLRFRLFRIGT